MHRNNGSIFIMEWDQKFFQLIGLFGGLALIKNVRETYSTIGAVLIFIPNLPLATKLRD